VESIKCYIAKDDKNACLDPYADTDKTHEAVEFLAKHRQCQAINSKVKVLFNVGIVEGCPIKAYCYIRAGQCGEITKANLPELDRNYLAGVNAFCHDNVNAEQPQQRRIGKRQQAKEKRAWMDPPPMGTIYDPPSSGRSVQIRNRDGTNGVITHEDRYGFVQIRTQNGKRIQGTLSGNTLNVRD
jgi:hypothetical protein